MRNRLKRKISVTPGIIVEINGTAYPFYREYISYAAICGIAGIKLSRNPIIKYQSTSDEGILNHDEELRAVNGIAISAQVY